jgi:hypothetical protein
LLLSLGRNGIGPVIGSGAIPVIESREICNDLKAAFAKDIVVEKRDGGKVKGGIKVLYETVRIRGG